MNVTQYFSVGIFTFALALGLMLAALKLFPKWGLVDRPHKYGLKRKPIPYYGGLVIFAAFAIAVLTFLPLSPDVLGVLLAGGLLVFVSFLDDLYGLPPLLRLAVHILVGVIIVFSGIGIHSLSNPFGEALSLDGYVWDFTIMQTNFSISLFSAAFTIAWVVLIVNSLNFLDGLHGLTSGVTTIAAAFLFILSIREGFHEIDQTIFSMMALIVFFVALAFVIFDFYPAKILMGDSGSMFLGFMLAVLAIFSGGKVATVFLIMGVPILDAFWVIGRRIYNKRLPWKGDLFHLHHRLKDTGLSERKVVLGVYFVTIIFGILALIPGAFYKLMVAGALVVLMLILGLYLTFWRK